MKAVVIHSGGQDSTTCLLWAKKNFEEVHAITFSYNQRHRVELLYAMRACQALDVPQKVISLDFLPEIVTSALTGDGSVSELNEKNLPSSFVPNRNQLFITLAHAYAQKIGASVLVGGMCETDYSGYPDCRRDFIDLIEKTSNVGSDSLISIKTPLMYLDKAETFALAEELGGLDLIINNTMTCYEGEETLNEFGRGCGKCPACQLRQRGYAEFRAKKTS